MMSEPTTKTTKGKNGSRTPDYDGRRDALASYHLALEVLRLEALVRAEIAACDDEPIDLVLVALGHG